MTTVLCIAALVALVKIRHYLYWGGGRWMWMKIPNNVFYLKDYRDKS